MSEKLMSTGERIARKYVAHQITIAKFAAEIDAAIAEALPRVDDAMVQEVAEAILHCHSHTKNLPWENVAEHVKPRILREAKAAIAALDMQ